jgi:transcriptional regulator with XRE-family HTH domain
MKVEKLTPSEVVAANVRMYMQWRGFTQDDLADRMTKIGMGFQKNEGGRTEWHRRTIGQILSGDRRIDVNELFGLAVALETTVGALLSPLVGGIANFDGRYSIGDLEPLGFRDFEILLEDPSEKKEPRPRLVVDEWPISRHSEDVPIWVKQPTRSEQLFAADVAEFQERHPDIDMRSASAADVIELIKQDKADGEVM